MGSTASLGTVYVSKTLLLIYVSNTRYHSRGAGWLRDNGTTKGVYFCNQGGSLGHVLGSMMWDSKWANYMEFQRYFYAWHQTNPLPSVSYSQMAAKSTYRPTKRASKTTEPCFDLIFPPLPRGPPPPSTSKQHSLPLPLGLFDSIQSTTSPPLSSKPEPEFQFDATPVKVFIDWCEGRIQCLSPYVASEIGLDLWLYDLRGKPYPTFHQELQLKKRILDLAYKSPLKLYENIENRTLKNFLGPGFDWLECPIHW